MSAWQSMRNEARFAWGIATRRPFQILLQVTNRCNMSCGFCGFWDNCVPPRQELTLVDYRRLEVDMAAMASFMVSIEGGEPLLRPDLVEIVRVFGRRHIPLLFTNGWLVDEPLAEALFGAGLVQVGVSIDFPDAVRHDAKRGLLGAYDRAVRAVELLRQAAPYGGKQVHIMTVLMKDNAHDMEGMLQLSQSLGVGHNLTLLSDKGFRRGTSESLPTSSIAGELKVLWRRYPHFRVLRRYLDLMEPYLAGEAMPTCGAGMQTFNVDHVGNVAPCIEKINRSVGNIRQERLGPILERMKALDEVKSCQDCWTLCRGFGQVLGKSGAPSGWLDLATRLQSR